jgi:hypothetical protein
MPQIKNPPTGNKYYLLLLILTLLIGMPPFILYGAARLSGALPSYQVWQSYLGNHGPWAFSWEADFISTSILLMVALLPFGTFLVSVITGFNASSRRFYNFLKGMGLVFLQLLWAYMIMITMFWAID